MEQKKENKIGKVIAIVFVILVALSALTLTLVGFITDFMWFKEMGYVSVFLTEILTKIKLGLPAFIFGALVTALLLMILKRNYLKKNKMTLDDKGVKRFRVITLVLSAIYGLMLAITVIPELWFEILKFMNATDFSISDPLFGYDLGFYIFKLEFLEGIAGSATSLVFVLIAITVIYFILLLAYSKQDTPSEAESYDYEFPEENAESDKDRKAKEFLNRLNKGNPDAGKNFKAKLKALLSVAAGEVTFLGVLFFLSVGVNCYLKRYDLLYGGTGAAYGAGYTDIKVTLALFNVLMVLSVVAALLLAVAVIRKKLLIGVIVPAAMLLLTLLSGPAANLVQNFIVSPDELSKESTYLGYNIDYTQKAYDLEDIEVRDFMPAGEITRQDVLENMETFSNIRINDFEPAEQFYNQTQSIRSYYRFNDVDVDRYSVNGEYTQVFLSARELDKSKTDDSWLINHLKYTHGYGITLSRVDKVTASGQPDMLIDSIPPISEVPEIQIARPEIYYGEETDDYIIVNTNETEFDYPSGESNVYCSYEGVGGIKLDLMTRALFALREQSLKLLISNNITNDSRIMIYRNIAERVEKIAPFLAYDDDPYVVVDEGRIYWIINAYTMSEYYPYSEPYSKNSDVNYIRNSVKVVIDAYNGTTDFYIVDEEDPIAQTLAKIYPDLFKDYGKMPEGLKSHLQYPNALFSIQASVYEKYHMNDVQALYQSEDLWVVSNELYGQAEKQMTPNYFIMKLPGEDSSEFVSTLTYSPNGKSNMTAIIVARNDGENYGQIILYKMPKDRIIYGPAQIEAQINQDAEISKEFALWNNSGSYYSRGNMFVIPVESQLLYCEPIYLESSTSSLPEVKRVIMYYGDDVAYEETLADCLDTLFGEGTGRPLRTPFPLEAAREELDRLLNPEPEEITTPAQPPADTPQITEPPLDENGNPVEEPQGGFPELPEVPEGADLSGLALDELAILAKNAYQKALESMQSGDWTNYGIYMDKLADYLEAMNQ